jgi:hypothetical protein
MIGFFTGSAMPVSRIEDRGAGEIELVETPDQISGGVSGGE